MGSILAFVMLFSGPPASLSAHLLPRQEAEMFWRKAAPPPGVAFAGQHWTWEDLCRHLVVLGGTGKGKSFASNYLLIEIMRAGGPMLFNCVSESDFERIYGCAKAVGHEKRVVEITPHNSGFNLMDWLLKPDGDPANAAQLLRRIGEVGQRENTGGGDSAFWDTHAERATMYSIAIQLAIRGYATVMDTHQIIITAPEHQAEVATSPAWNTDYGATGPDGKPLKRGLCCQMILEGYRRGLDKAHPAFAQAAAYMTSEMVGSDRMRGGIIATANNCLGRFTFPPWDTALSGKSTITPRDIDEGRLIAVLNHPILTHGVPAKMWQFAYGMEADRHCLRRPYKQGAPPFVKVSDEAAHVLNPHWSAMVTIVARKHGLAFIDLIQDISTLLMGIGGHSHKAEAMSWLANHGSKLCFGTDDAETQSYMSKLIGQRLEVIPSGGGGQCKTGDWYADALGASPANWSASYQPAIRPEYFSSLPTGVAVLHADGGHRIVDFRSK